MSRPNFCPWEIPSTTAGQLLRLREAWIQLLAAAGFYRAIDRLARAIGRP